MATSDAQPPPAGPPSGAATPPPARSWFDRIDGAVYGIEQAIVIGALLVMTVTYVLTVLRNNAVREVNTFDKLLISLSGYEDQIQAPPDVVASITTLWTPLLLGLVVFGLTLLALRTRERSGLAPGEAPPRPNWPRRLILAAVITGLLAGLVLILKSAPLTWVCVIALLLLIGVTMYYAFRTAERPPLSRIVAALLGGVVVVYYFVSTENWTHVGVGAVLMIYVGFFGASMATRDDKHISVDAIRKAIKSRYYHIYQAVSWTVTALFTGFLLVMALLAFSRNLDSDATHQASQIPLYIVIAPIVIAFGLMVVRCAVRVARSIAAFRRGDPAPSFVVEAH